MNAIESEALAQATLIGARRHGHDSGQTYRRRRLTAKQMRLLALLADGDAVGAEDLASAFPKEWHSIVQGHPDRDLTANSQALFENLCDLASRINAYLLAGYRDSLLRAKMLPLLGGKLVAIASSFADLEMWTVGAETLHELLPVLAVTESHRKRTTTRTPRPDASPENAPLPIPAPEVPHEAAMPGASNVPSGLVLPPTSDRSEAAPAPPPSPTSAPEPEKNQPPPDVIPATVNLVTLRWTLQFPEGEVEADPRLATIRSGSQIRRWHGDDLPEDPEALTPAQVDQLRRMASQ